LAKRIPSSQAADPPYGSQKPPLAHSLLATQGVPATRRGMQVPFAQYELLSHGTVALHDEGGLLVPSGMQLEMPEAFAAQ
jgi:hypothetical protein